MTRPRPLHFARLPRLVTLSGLLMAALAPPPAAALSPPPATVKVVLKFMKRQALDAPAAVFQADSCAACALGTDDGYAANNPLETIVELIVPTRRSLEVAFTVGAPGVRRVLLETGDVDMAMDGARLTLRLPPLTGNAITAGEYATHIVEPGMVLRFEHADPRRRAGAYAAGPFPTVERRAADNLTFAQREFVRLSGLGAYVAKERLGTLELMGFDTNFPHAHSDSPPHVHMHLRWPDVAGTQIGHFYLDPNGLLSETAVGGGQFLQQKGRKYGKGETFVTIDRLGRPAYRHTITAEGWLRLATPDGPDCLIRPEREGGGFDSGAVLACPGLAPQHIAVTDDLKGTLTVRTNAIVETFRYDPDTGALRSPARPAPPPPSAYPPPD